MSTLLLAWVVALLGCASLALAMERHRRYFGADRLGRRAVYGGRVAGALLLALSLWLCVAQWRPSVGTAVWLGVFTFAALALGLIFTYCSRKACLGLLVAALCLGAAMAAMPV